MNDWNPRDLPGASHWDASTYRPGKPWKAKRSYPAWRRRFRAWRRARLERDEPTP